MNASPLVSIRSVCKTFRRRQGTIEVLHNISLELGKGEVTHLTGPSGSGKTTLLNLIAALDHPDSGTIVVAGEDLARLSLAAAAKFRSEYVGIVFQSYNLLPQLTALENVLLPAIARGCPNRQRALDLLDAVGLNDRCRHRPPELSGGEQQRVAIARALVCDPDLVLADEPTGNLDDQNARDVLDLLYASCREHGKALLLVTHDRNATQPADAVFELRRGMLVPAGDELAT